MRPLFDIRVLDLSRLLPGPFATLVLADLGATVDKIEDPQQGDYLRQMPPQVAGVNAGFGLLNRGKRSCTLDLKKAEGRDALLAILGSYDVLFEQFRPGVLARLGLAPEALRARFPRLVIASLTGYGQTGPLARRAGHDLNYVARSGVLGVQGPAEGLPQMAGVQLADISGGMWSVIAILSALRHRDKTGEGAWLDLAMSEGTLPFLQLSLGAALAHSPQPRGDEQLSGGIAPYNVYASGDGRAMTLAALEPKFWMTFCAAFGLSPSMADLVPGPHQAELKSRVAAIVASKSRAEWDAWADQNDVPIEPVLAPAELRDDAHLKARGVFFELPSEEGALPQVRTPVSPRDLSGAGLPPARGAHTREVLAAGGLSTEAIDALIASGAAS